MNRKPYEQISAIFFYHYYLDETVF